MGQLVSYRGSSVRGTERYSGARGCARRHRARGAHRERVPFPRRRALSCPSTSTNLCIHAEDIRAGTRNRRLISRTRSATRDSPRERTTEPDEPRTRLEETGGRGEGERKDVGIREEADTLVPSWITFRSP